MPPVEQISLFRTLASAFLLSAIAGFAALLRENKPLTARDVISCTLNSAILGTAMCGLSFNRLRDNVPFLYAICLLSGLAGRLMVEVVATSTIVWIKKKFGPDGSDRETRVTDQKQSGEPKAGV